MNWFADVDAALGSKPSPQREARRRADPIPLGDGPAPHLARRPRRRVYHDATRASNARKVLTSLPEPGETHHYLMRGEYDAFDLVDVLLELTGYAESLYLATLGFNSANATRLVEMLDGRRVCRACMLVSCYYEADKKEADVCYKLAKELPARGGWYCAARNHCKIVAANTAAGPFVIESSANLRSCKSLEQFTVTHEGALYDFHVGWMERVRTETAAKIAAKKEPRK